MDEAVIEAAVDAALAADAEWMRRSRSVVFTSPSRDQVRMMLEAAAPLIAVAEGELIAKLADKTGAICTSADGTSCFFSALIRGGAHDG